MPTDTTPVSSAKTIFDGSLASLMAHTIRSVINHFRNHALNLEITVAADTYDTISLKAPNSGATSVLCTRFRPASSITEWARVHATIYIHRDANKNLARICIAHEVYHLLLELQAYIDNKRTSWGNLSSSKQMEDECNQFAWELCSLHDQFNRNDQIRERLLYFPPDAFQTALKTHTVENHLEWPKGIGLDPNEPFHKKPVVLPLKK